MLFKGVLRKMRTVRESPVLYFLSQADKDLAMNQLIGKNISLRVTGSLCLNCHKSLPIYRMGHCFECFMKSPYTASWIINPELSQAHLGIEDRDLEIESKVQLQAHYVYLALSGQAKVGVTRSTQVPTRWIDQGASSALPIFKLPHRQLAGQIEVFLKQFLSDKTNWRLILTGNDSETDLLQLKNEVYEKVPSEWNQYKLKAEIDHFNYPVLHYPSKVKSLNLYESKYFEGGLVGIRGQYLLFADGWGFNIRANEGMVIEMEMLNKSFEISEQLSLF